MGVKVAEGTVQAFLESLASSSPTPGGGSVAAVCGAMGAALAGMVCRLTIGKEKFAEQEGVMKETLAKSEALRTRLLKLAEEDANAFDGVMAAFRMPKGTEEEKAARQVTIQAALRVAAEVPMMVMGLSLEVAELAQRAAEHGNPSAISDAGVAAILASTAVEGASLNVRINLASIKDEEFVSNAGRTLVEMEKQAKAVEGAVLKIVQGTI